MRNNPSGKKSRKSFKNRGEGVFAKETLSAETFRKKKKETPEKSKSPQSLPPSTVAGGYS